METKLSEFAKNALNSADAEGKITIPCASACEIEALLEELSELEKIGYLSRSKGKALYRPFFLTEQGKELKKSLPGNAQALSA